MITIRSNIFILILVIFSNTTFSQNEEPSAYSIVKNAQKDNKLSNGWSKTDSIKLQSTGLYSDSNLLFIRQRRQYQFEKTFTKYLELSTDDLRFNLNFEKVDQYKYSSNKENNLSLMRNEMPIYNKYSYYQPSFAESFLFEIALGILGKR